MMEVIHWFGTNHGTRELYCVFKGLKHMTLETIILTLVSACLAFGFHLSKKQFPKLAMIPHVIDYLRRIHRNLFLSVWLLYFAPNFHFSSGYNWNKLFLIYESISRTSFTPHLTSNNHKSTLRKSRQRHNKTKFIQIQIWCLVIVRWFENVSNWNSLIKTELKMSSNDWIQWFKLIEDFILTEMNSILPDVISLVWVIRWRNKCFINSQHTYLKYR